jgi:ribonuclease D
MGRGSNTITAAKTLTKTSAKTSARTTRRRSVPAPVIETWQHLPVIAQRARQANAPAEVEQWLEAERAAAYQDYRHEYLRRRLLTDTDEVRQLVAVLDQHQVKQIALDFETAQGRNEAYGVSEGRLRLIQVGIDHPDWKGRRQWIIDCDQADPRPLVPLLRDWKVEKLIHWSPFEQLWSQVHLDTSIGNVYDTGLAFQSINKELERWQADNRAKRIKDIIIGWEGKHSAQMGQLAERYLGIALPKEGQSSDWRGQLDDEQLDYAALDVVVPFDLAPLTKELTQALGIERRVTWRLGNARKEAAAERAGGMVRSRELAWALVDAESCDELDRAWQEAQGTGIGWNEHDELQAFYTERRQELSI